MRVCVLLPVFDSFKGGNHLPLLAAAHDVQFTILTSRRIGESPLPPNINVVEVPTRLGPYYYGFSDARFARAVLKTYPVTHPFWKEFDVLHLNQTLGSSFQHLPETGRPVLLFIHHPVSVDRALAVQETSGIESLQWRLRYVPLERWQRTLCNALPHIATVSQTVKQRLAADYGCDPAAISIVPNGVDGTVFTSGTLEESSFDVIAVGSLLHPRKGFKYLLQTYESLAARGYRIADVGRRSAAQQAVLQRISAVTIFGIVDQGKLLSLLQQSRALISTSLYEGFGLSLIEALACGRPAFAFDAGATKEVLDPIDPSLTVPARDVARLVERVEAFLSQSPTECAAQGRVYRESVLRKYSLEQSASTLKALYSQLAQH